jgi:hypothetical protein
LLLKSRFIILIEFVLMNYRLRRRGENLGVFSLEELRRRRDAGELSGGEYVQSEGASDWQPLDWVLQHGYRALPSPPASAVSTGGPNQTFIWVAIVVGVVVCVAAVALFGVWVGRFQQHYLSILNQSRGAYSQSRPQAVAAASKPIVWTTNTLTEADAQKRGKEFVTRQWLDGYEQRARRNAEDDNEIIQFLRTWIDYNYDGPQATNSTSLGPMAEKLAADTNCTDPLVLTIVALNSIELHEAVRRLERAVNTFPDSDHKAYPRFYATLMLASYENNQPDRVRKLDSSALVLFQKCFADGSFLPKNQQVIAELLVNASGYDFFYRNAAAVCQIAHEAGPHFKWLALVLDGEDHIMEAWRARGSGSAGTVTQQGWEGFNKHLALARKSLTEAWRLEPDFPLAPCRMIYVSLGDSDITEMRLWFDRTVADQIDYPEAWSEMRWGLRPRWYGNEKAMLAFGVTALNTGRFDTDVPRKLFDSISDIESEMDLAPGQYIYGRTDIWPNLQRMYEGYIAACQQSHSRILDGWRSTYAVVAYFAGNYGVASNQLAALDWKPWPGNLTRWGTDLSLMPLEVAARTGPLGDKIAGAETSYHAGDTTGALQKYTALSSATNADKRTREFIRCRLAALKVEQQLQTGQWVNFLPTGTNDPDWVVSRGEIRRLADGALEVKSGPAGHFLYSRARVGPNFEVKGEFEVVHSSTKSFQAGLVMGTPDLGSYEWDAFRIKRNSFEGDVACFARGWTPRQIVRHIVLNSVLNSFDFRFQNGRVSASVNGSPVFQDDKPPAAIDTPADDFLLGLGAFNDSNDTVIRYRNVQVRKLKK